MAQCPAPLASLVLPASSNVILGLVPRIHVDGGTELTMDPRNKSEDDDLGGGRGAGGVPLKLPSPSTRLETQPPPIFELNTRSSAEAKTASPIAKFAAIA